MKPNPATLVGMPTRVLGASGNNKVGVFHRRFDEAVEVFSDEPVVPFQDAEHVSASLLDISHDSATQADIRVAVDEDLDVHQVSETLG